MKYLAIALLAMLLAACSSPGYQCTADNYYCGGSSIRTPGR